MTSDELTGILVQRVLGWRVAPGRFLKQGRQWTPSWRFQPLRRLQNALELIEKAQGEYRLAKGADGTFTAEVSVGNRRGSASAQSEAATITVALARALGIDVPDELLEAYQA
jgi:hypothetical protein